MSDLPVQMSDDLRSFVETRVETGGYLSEIDYVVDLIRRDCARVHLRDLVLDGASSPLGPTADEEYFESLRERARWTD